MRCTHDHCDSSRKFKAAAENEYQKRMREIMLDNACELYMGEMKVICEPEGIKLHTSVRYSPESNGVAERCAMLHDSGLPNSLWAGAFSTTTYVRT